MGLFTFVSYFTYSGINNALQIGMDYEWYNDVFIINLTTQFLVSFSDYGWILYLVVPGYLVYKVIMYIVDYVFTPTAEEMAENDPKNKKKMDKKSGKSGTPEVQDDEAMMCIRIALHRTPPRITG